MVLKCKEEEEAENVQNPQTRAPINSGVNIPNIIGEEMNQEKARYPIFQSTNLLDNNSFLPSEVGNDKNYYKKEKDNNYLNTPNN